MNKKIFWIILIPALLIIGGYLFLRFSLQSSINKEKGAASARGDTTSLKQSSLLDLRPLFINKLQQLVTKSSDGLYALSVAGMGSRCTGLPVFRYKMFPSHLIKRYWLR